MGANSMVQNWISGKTWGVWRGAKKLKEIFTKLSTLRQLSQSGPDFHMGAEYLVGGVISRWLLGFTAARTEWTDQLAQEVKYLTTSVFDWSPEKFSVYKCCRGDDRRFDSPPPASVVPKSSPSSLRPVFHASY